MERDERLRGAGRPILVQPVTAGLQQGRGPLVATPIARDDVRPYPVSWADRLTEWVARRPVSEALVYAAAWVVLYGTLTAVQWAQGGYPVGTLNLVHATITGSTVGFIWLTGRFNRAAGLAVARLRPVLVGDDADVAALTYRLTHLPALPVLIGGLGIGALSLGRLLVFPTMVTDVGFASTSVSFVLASAYIVLLGFCGVAFVAKMVALSRGIYHLSKERVTVDLARLRPLHALSGLTARMAASMVLVTVVFVAARPEEISTDPLGTAFVLSGVVTAALIFVLPLVGIHGRLVEAKEAARSTSAQKLQATTRQLHAAVDEVRLADMDALNKAVAALDIEARALDRVSTWPWQQETLRWVIGALMFPIVLFVAQFVIGRLLGT